MACLCLYKVTDKSAWLSANAARREHDSCKVALTVCNQLQVAAALQLAPFSNRRATERCPNGLGVNLCCAEVSFTGNVVHIMCTCLTSTAKFDFSEPFSVNPRQAESLNFFARNTFGAHHS